MYSLFNVMNFCSLEDVRRINVVDGKGREVGSEAGPYIAGETLKLVCTARGGERGL